MLSIVSMFVTYPMAHKPYAGKIVYKLCGGGTIPAPNYSPGAIYNMPCMASDQYVEKNNVAPFYISIAITSVLLIALIYILMNDKSSTAKTKRSSNRKN